METNLPITEYKGIPATRFDITVTPGQEEEVFIAKWRDHFQQMTIKLVDVQDLRDMLTDIIQDYGDLTKPVCHRHPKYWPKDGE